MSERVEVGVSEPQPYYQQLKAQDGHLIPLWHWSCAQPTQIVVIVHGFAEHSQRYRQLANFLHTHNRAVVVFDQRGHGVACNREYLGSINAKTGFWHWQNDLDQVITWIKDDYPHTPLIVYGHSMGSIISRAYMVDHSDKIQGLVLTGVATISPMMRALAHWFSFAVSKLFATKHSGFVQRRIFAGFNKRVPEPQSHFAWLSSDATAVAEYDADPLTGFVASIGFWHQVAVGLASIKITACQDKSLPIALFYGQQDPLVKYGKTMQGFEKQLQTRGFSNVHSTRYSEMRHELQHEQQRGVYFVDLLAWLDKQLVKK